MYGLNIQSFHYSSQIESNTENIHINTEGQVRVANPIDIHLPQLRLQAFWFPPTAPWENPCSLTGEHANSKQEGPGNLSQNLIEKQKH